MTMNDNTEHKVLDGLLRLTHETEWIEFKQNFHSAEEIGERLSALSNGACLQKKPYAYLVFGIHDESHEVVGTTFHAKSHKKGNEELEMWLVNRLNPRIDIEVSEFEYEGKHISMYKIPAASNRPVTFLNEAYIRVGSLTKPLMNYPDKEAKIWATGNQKPLDRIPARTGLSSQDVVSILSVQTYFDLMHLPMPQNQQAILERLISEKLVIEYVDGYSITELGALVFAKNLRDFDTLYRKAIRVIIYKGKDKLNTEREKIFEQGYALSFPAVAEWINDRLPANEEIGRSLRNSVQMYPELSIRELIGNLLIHQDFSEKGFPMIEMYDDRIVFSNPGLPLISIDRFIDEYQSRNESLSDLMRRLGFCEEKGSGLDKVISTNELYQLPPIGFQIDEHRTILTMYAYKMWSEMDKKERLQACYQHACLKYVSNEMMTNQSLRQRLCVDDKNYPMISRLIKDAITTGLIKEGNPENKSNRMIGYVPIWA